MDNTNTRESWSKSGCRTEFFCVKCQKPVDKIEFNDWPWPTIECFCHGEYDCFEFNNANQFPLPSRIIVFEPTIW